MTTNITQGATARPWVVDTGSSSVVIRSGIKRVGEAVKLVDALFIVKAVNSHDSLVTALKRLLESNAVMNSYQGEEEMLCYCDDYKAPEVCEFCNAKNVLKQAQA